jgi:hypothetical protein
MKKAGNCGDRKQIPGFKSGKRGKERKNINPKSCAHGNSKIHKFSWKRTESSRLPVLPCLPATG